MTSLPQDFHYFTDPVKKTNLPKTEIKTVLPTLRKRWNESETPKRERTTHASLIKRNSVPTVPNVCKNKSPVLQTKSSMNVSKLSQNKLPDCSNKSLSKLKESQIELATLRKEVGSLKAENSILKARVRRVDDENSQKSRQIDKLQSEIKLDVINNKKNKENESLSVLRQKCLRLESALKEKDMFLKRLVSDLDKVDELKEILQKYHKELGIPNGVGSEIFHINSRNNSHMLAQTTESKSIPKQNRINLNHQLSKSETEKLRSFIHKLEAENTNLQSQGKEKDQEIRRLKLQIQHLNTSSSGSVTKLSRKNSIARSSSPIQSKSPNTSSSHLVIRKAKTPNITLSSRTPSRTQQVKTTCSPNIRPTTSSKNSTFIVKERHSASKQRPVIQRSTSCIESEEVPLEQKVQSMRENAAARKIQKGWRHHKKMANKDLTKEQEKALNTIVDYLKAHQLRREKLLICTEENTDLVMTLPENTTENAAIKVDAIFKNIWGTVTVA